MLGHKSSRTAEQGFTITELLVVMVVIGIISGLVYVFFSRSLIDFIRVQAANITAVDQSYTIGRIEQVLRGVNKVEDAQANTLTVYTYFSPTDTTPSKVVYTYDAASKQLRVSHILASGTAPDYTYNAANAVNRVILSGLVQTKPLFSYADRLGGVGPFDTSTYSDIATITVTIDGTVKGNAAPTEMKATVLLRNRTGVQ